MQPLEPHRLHLLAEERQRGVWRDLAPPKRVISLVEEDIRAKIGAYLHYQVPLGELLGFLDNPHLLWDVLEQAVRDPVFYQFAARLRRITTFYTENSHIPECEVYPLFARLLATPSPP